MFDIEALDSGPTRPAVVTETRIWRGDQQGRELELAGLSL